MRFACLIVTYTSAELTTRMIKKMDNGDFDFYIHLDKKVDINTHSALFDMPNVIFIKDRIDVKWAGYTVVQASFNGLKEIRASGKKYEFINLLSGQDYPLKSADYISKFLSAQVGKQLIKHWDFETEWDEAFARIHKYHFTDTEFKGRYLLQRIINSIVKRKPPTDLRFYGTSSTFWTLSPECAYYVMDYCTSRPKFERFLKFTWGSDEFIFQTIIMNSHWKEQVHNNNYRYIDWSGGGSHPKLLTTEDYEKIIATDNILGRKFNMDADTHVLDLIDEHNSIEK
jgi:Core-2/I-Branching enzyme